MWWNFVERSAEDIIQARDDWQAGRRFGNVDAYHGERLPAPALTGCASHQRPQPIQENQTWDF